MKLSIEELKDILRYEPDTGAWIRLKTRGPCIKWSEAGNISADGYRKLRINGKDYLSARLAFFYMNGRWPIQMDHINRIRLDDRWSNLREVNQQQNNFNQGLRVDNSSGVKGVSWYKSREKWVVQMNVYGKPRRFGYYKDIELAELVASEAHDKYQGQYAATAQILQKQE
ncbi:HNH endonuclease [Ewingella sp. S1.OA.A_B6]